MARITFICRNGIDVETDAGSGTLMHAALNAGVTGIKGDCGGSAACATCHIYVPPAWTDAVGPAGEAELAMLEFEDEATPQSRLACQIDVSETLDGLKVHVVAAD